MLKLTIKMKHRKQMVHVIFKEKDGRVESRHDLRIAGFHWEITLLEILEGIRQVGEGKEITVLVPGDWIFYLEDPLCELKETHIEQVATLLRIRKEYQEYCKKLDTEDRKEVKPSKEFRNLEEEDIRRRKTAAARLQKVVEKCNLSNL